MSTQKSQTFKENDIRLDERIEKQKAYLLPDIDYILHFKGDFITLNCPAYDANDFKVSFQKHKLDLCDYKILKTIVLGMRTFFRKQGKRERVT
jgi:hypothetical protein